MAWWGQDDSVEHLARDARLRLLSLTTPKKGKEGRISCGYCKILVLWLLLKLLKEEAEFTNSEFGVNGCDMRNLEAL